MGSDDCRTIGTIHIDVRENLAARQERFRFTARVTVNGSPDDHSAATLAEAVESGAKWAADMLSKDIAV